MDIRITKLAPSDWQKYKNLRLEALQSFPEAFGSSYAKEAAAPDSKWQQRLEEAEREETAITLFAVDAEGNPHGMMTVYWDTDPRTRHVGNLVGVYVDKTMHGQGIASKLLTEILQKLKNKGQHRKIRAQVMNQNTAAIKLYSKFGFQKVGEFKQEFYDGDRYLDDDVMELFF